MAISLEELRRQVNEQNGRTEQQSRGKMTLTQLRELTGTTPQTKTAEDNTSAAFEIKDSLPEKEKAEKRAILPEINAGDTFNEKVAKVKVLAGVEEEKGIRPEDLPDNIKYQGINNLPQAMQAAGRVWNTVGSAVTGAAGGVMTAGEGAVQFISGEKGQALKQLMDENRNAALGIEAGADMQGIVNDLQYAKENEKLNTDTAGAKLLAKSDEMMQKAVRDMSPVNQFMTQTIISVLENALMMPLALVNPLLATGTFAASAAGRSMYDSTMDGKSLSEAFSRGIIDGTIELATEKIGVDAWLDTVTGKGGGVIKNLLKQSGSEAGEEALSYFAGWLMDKAAKDPDAEFSMQDLMMSAAGGALSGLILGGGTLAMVGRDNFLKAANGGTTEETAPAETEKPQTEDKAVQRAEENLQIVQELEQQGLDTQTEQDRLQEVITGENRVQADPAVVEKENARIAAVEEAARQGNATAEDVQNVQQTARENIRQSENKAAFKARHGDDTVQMAEELAKSKGYEVVWENDTDPNAPNAYIEGNKIYLNAASDNPAFAVAVHEVGHGLKNNTAKWNKFEKSMLQLIAGSTELTKFADAVTERYAGQGKENTRAYKSLLTDGKFDQGKLNEEIVLKTTEELISRAAVNDESLMAEIKKDRSLIDGLLDIIRGIKNNLKIRLAKSEKAMLDEAERNLVNLLRSESREQGNNNVKFSISDHIIGVSGKDYGKGVYLDSTLLDDLSEKEQKKMVKERIKELGGNDFTAYDNNNNPVQIKIAPKGQKFTNRKGKRVDVSHDLATKNNDNENKRIIVVHSDELIETANFDSVNPSKYTHGWLDNYKNNPWDTWKVFVQQKNNSVWEAQLRVANSRNGEKYLYDVVEIKMVEGGVKSPPTTTINNIPQTADIDNGKKKSGDIGRFSLKIQNVDDHKQKQLDIVQATNPMHDDYHTGIRTVEDIYTADEVFTEDEFAGTPDWTYEAAQTALEKGKVTVYSSYPISDGVFVTPSRMTAQDYAGKGKVYSKEVPLEAVAWIDSDEGQYAPVNKDVRYSVKIGTDSAGNTLTEQQQEYFKDSKVRDENGQLKVMYHGTPNAGFTVFRSGTYFTENPEYAEVYKNPGASSLSVKRSADNPDVYAVYLNIKKPFDTRNRKEKRIFQNEYYRQWGTGAPLTERGLPDWTDGMDLQEFIEEMEYDYDGLILDEGGVFDEKGNVKSRGLSYVVFSPEQVKNVDNKTPTTDKDIRYSVPVYQYDGETAKSRGIRSQAVNEFADSLGGMFGITGKIGREGLRKSDYNIADRVEKFGFITKADMDNFFDAAYQAARFTDEKADYAPLKKRIREAGIEPLGGREYLDFVQKYRGKIKFKRGGLPIDTLYQELNENYPEYFPDSIINPYEQMEKLGEIYDSLRRLEMSADEYFGDYAREFRAESYDRYARQVDLFVDRINSVSRYKKANTERKAARDRVKAEVPKEYTLDAVRKAHKDAERISKEISKVMKNAPLTEEDQALIDDLLKIKSQAVLTATLKDMQKNNPNAKEIYKLFSLKQELQQVKEPVRGFAKAKKDRSRETFMELLTTSKSWREKHRRGGLRYRAETFERIIDDIVTDKKAAEKLKDLLPRSIHKHVAEGNRYKNELRERVKALKLDTEKLYDVEFENKNNQVIVGQMSESGLVQIYGEGLIGKEYLDKIGADVDKITAAATEFRKIYNEMLERINEAYVRNGYKPVEYRRDYFPHFMEDGTDTLLNKMTSWFGIDAMSKVPSSWQRGLAKLTIKSYTENGMLPTEIAGKTYQNKPGRKWNPHALQRVGENTVYDALKGFDNYLETATDVIFLTDDIQNLRSFEDSIRYKFSDKGVQEELDSIDEMEDLSPQEKWNRKREIYEDKNRNKYLNNFVGWLHNYTNLLAGKKDFADRHWEENLGRGIYQLSKDLESRVAANMVAGNISSAMTNFIPIAQMTTAVKEKYIFSAMSDTVKNMKNDDGFAFQSDFLTNRFGSERLVDDSLAAKLQNMRFVGDVLGIMETVDQFTSNVVVRAKYMQNINEGMTHDVAMQDADEFAAGLMADRSKGALPTIFETKNPVTKALTMFQVEQNNQLQYLVKDLPRSLGDKDEIGKLLMMALLKYSLYSWLYNWMYEKLAGRKPAFSPIDLMADTGKDFYRAYKGEMKGSEAVTNAVVNVAEELPFAAAPLAMSGLSDDAGRLPISGALPDFANVLKLFDKEISVEKKKSILYKEMSKPMYYLLFPVGGGQVKKTGEALYQMAVNDGVSYYTNNNGSKNVQFAVDTSNPLKWAQSAAFGRWSTKEAREYVEGGFNYLNKVENGMFEYLTGLGVSNQDAYEQVAGAKKKADADGNGSLKTAEVVRYLDSTGMSRTDKANMFSIMLPNVKNNPYK